MKDDSTSYKRWGVYVDMSDGNVYELMVYGLGASGVIISELDNTLPFYISPW